MTTIVPVNGAVWRNSNPQFEPSPLGHSLRVWLALQNGQESITRFSGYANRFGSRVRHQSGYDHLASVMFLCAETLIALRPYVALDELMVTRCFEFHDVPEGLLHRDILAPLKRRSDDVNEYWAFRRLFETLSEPVWKELERSFLLQFALEDNDGFPEDASAVLSELRAARLNEAWAFDGIQRVDYLFYAEECCDKRGVSLVLEEIAANQFAKIELVAHNLPGFAEVCWTPERRDYFSKWMKK